MLNKLLKIDESKIECAFKCLIEIYDRAEVVFIMFFVAVKILIQEDERIIVDLVNF